MYKGIVKYFNQVDGSPLEFLPEPPDHVIAYNSDDGEITIAWEAPPSGGIYGDAATAYDVYMGTHGCAFSDPMTTSSTSLIIENLDPNTTYYFEVGATNNGRQSFPSSTIAARTPSFGNTVGLLLVDGFDRLD